MVSLPILLLIGVLLLAGCRGGSSGPEKSPTYRIGYMICNSEQETLERFVPLTAYLSRELGVNFEPRAIDTINFTREIDELDFTHTNSLLYIMLHRLHGVSILAGEQKGSLGEKSQGIIITRRDSGIERVEDLRGGSMIFGPALGPTGFMSQIDILQQHGLDPDNDLAFYTIPRGSFKHEKVAYGVWFEKYDAGALPLDDLETMDSEGRLPAEDFTIVARGPAIPYCNFGFSQRVEERLAKRFLDAVLALDPDDTVEIDGETVRVLKRAGVEGYMALEDSDFDVVREMARRTNMPPYQKY